MDEVIDVMQENITKVIERGERLDDLQDKSGVVLNAALLASSPQLFHVAGTSYLVSVKKAPNDRPRLVFLSFLGVVFSILGLQVWFSADILLFPPLPSATLRRGVILEVFGCCDLVVPSNKCCLSRVRTALSTLLARWLAERIPVLRGHPVQRGLSGTVCALAKGVTLASAVALVNHAVVGSFPQTLSLLLKTQWSQ